MAGRKEELADDHGIKIRIETPAVKEYFSRGFYQTEEDCLYIPIFPSGKFYSFIDSPPSGKKTIRNRKQATGISLDIDSKGRLLFIKVNTPRRFWKTDNSLEVPSTYETADIRFLTFREQINPPAIILNPAKSILQLRFNTCSELQAFRLAESLTIATSADGKLNSIWLSSITDDRAAKKMAQWRKDRLEELLEDDSGPPGKFTRIEIE